MLMRDGSPRDTWSTSQIGVKSEYVANLLNTDLGSSMSFEQIGYEQDNFLLETPLDMFRFFFELHNLPSVLPSDPDLRGAYSRLLHMEQQVRAAKLEGFTARKTGKRDGPNNTDESARSGNGRSAPFGDASTLRRLSNAGYQVLQAPDTGDWVPLRPVSPAFILHDRQPFTDATTVEANS